MNQAGLAGRQPSASCPCDKMELTSFAIGCPFSTALESCGQLPLGRHISNSALASHHVILMDRNSPVLSVQFLPLGGGEENPPLVIFPVCEISKRTCSHTATKVCLRPVITAKYAHFLGHFYTTENRDEEPEQRAIHSVLQMGWLEVPPERAEPGISFPASEAVQWSGYGVQACV